MASLGSFAPSRRRFSGRRFVGVLVMLLAAWLFEFSTHLHQPESSGAPVTAEHACAFCAAFPAGAGPVADVPLFAAAPSAHVESSLRVPAPRPFVLAAYRSRAPPRIDLA